MKKINKSIFLIFICLVISSNLIAQSPSKINYQAVLRNSNNQLISNQTVGMQISILKGSATGTILYSETHSPTTNKYGLIAIKIGEGIVTSGNIDNIKWQNDVYFLKTETDPNGGTSYSITSTTQLVSVPYAFYSNFSGNAINDKDTSLSNEIQTLKLTGTNLELSDANKVDLSILKDGVKDDDADSTNELQVLSISNDTIFLQKGGFVKLPLPKYFIGMHYGGGIIFHIDSTGEHGLIMSKTDLNSGNGIEFGGNGTTITGASSYVDGKSNTAALVSQIGSGSYAAKLCVDYRGGGYKDWYLPATMQWHLMFNNAIKTGTLTGGAYWTSTHRGSTTARLHDFSTGSSTWQSKNNKYKVRAIREF